MKVNSIYTTFNGEVNPFGIGHPAIFLRLQGCHLRCYKLTLGMLCDTPEGLQKPKDSTKLAEILEALKEITDRTGIKLITLTGGDPLWNDKDELVELFTSLTDAGYSICVETSGTISWLPYSLISDNIFWILDYKLLSSGVKNADELFNDAEHLADLTEKDYIKFVVYDSADMDETIQAIKTLKEKTLATFGVGAYWGGKLSTFEIFNRLEREGVLDRAVVNAQLHKLVISPNTKAKIPTDI